MNSRRPARASRQLETTEILPQDGSEAVYDQALDEGEELGEYVIERLVGGGGGGLVYAARERASGRKVALKVLRAEMAVFPSMVARFVREAEAVNKIAHPNIVRVYGMHELAPGRPYYAMELLEGLDLRSHLHLSGRLPPREVLALLEPVCAAVHAAHCAGIIHRDIKANNVMIAEVEGERVVKLLDFGIAKMLGGEQSGKGLTEPGARLGTAHNMAPEQVRGEPLDARADIYALGVLLYQLLTGEYPFDAADPRQVAMMQLSAKPRRPSELAPLDPPLEAVVLRCLEKQPERRYGSALELLDALRRAVGEQAEEVGRARPAVAVYAEVAIAEDQELDDAAFEQLGTLLDAVESELMAAGYLFPLRTSNALLGMRGSEGGEALEHARGEAEARIRRLAAQLSARTDPATGIALTLAVASGEALFRAQHGRVEVVGGPLLEAAGWPASTRVATVPGAAGSGRERD